ncbi:MAG: histidine--tRNA ligase [Gemmatimonadaceae bacterium]|nr:histidine--tRNA ligase [Gemmatimonadaceae bacterium]
MSAGALPGFRDFYPESFAQRSWLFDRWRDVARQFGYVEYDGPPLEPLDLYTKKSGDEIVGQLYNFVDKGDRAVALRPEMTPTVARMVAARANALRKPVRWFSVPQLFRYERQQKGRLREHFQLNVDIFGESDVAADAELLAVACTIMRACGLGPRDVRARISDRRLLTAMLSAIGVSGSQMPTVFAAVDKVERDPFDVLVGRMTEAGVAKDAAEEVLALVQGTRGVTDIAFSERFARTDEGTRIIGDLQRYFDLLEAHGVRDYVELDLTIVRGLAYYTGIVFELFDARGDFRAICGGGRYDNLLQALGGAPMPALGFGMGDVVLTELLRAREKLPSGTPSLDFWVAPLDAAHRLSAVRVATQLRAVGARVESPLREQALGKQLKAAHAAGAREVVMVGQGYGDSGEVELKSFGDGTQHVIHVEQLLARIKGRMGGATDRP